FFFSSRRRHTRFSRDWSSDVCSSDLMSMGIFQTPGSNAREINNNIKKYLKSIEKDLPEGITYTINFDTNEFLEASISKVVTTLRSEERRVGKECRCRWEPCR